MPTTTLEVPGIQWCHDAGKTGWFDDQAAFEAAKREREAAGWLYQVPERQHFRLGIETAVYFGPADDDGDRPRLCLRLRLASDEWQWVSSIDDVRALAAGELASYGLVNFVQHHGYYVYTFSRDGMMRYVFQQATMTDLNQKPRIVLEYWLDGAWHQAGRPMALHNVRFSPVNLQSTAPDLSTEKLDLMRLWPDIGHGRDFPTEFRQQLVLHWTDALSA